MNPLIPTELADVIDPRTSKLSPWWRKYLANLAQEQELKDLEILFWASLHC